MKKIQVVHNPTAGDSEMSKEDILNKIRKKGREIAYVSMEDENWYNFEIKDEELIILAGGDGTIHKLAGVLLQKTQGQIPVPIYLLPVGTANNIAATVNISSPRDFDFRSIEGEFQLFDHGKISGIPYHPFFLEGVGYGLFPELIRVMKSAGDIPDETSKEKLQRTLKNLRNLAENLEPKMVEMEADGSIIKGKYLMAEIQNTRFLGPKLELAPVAEPGDGYLDLVLVSAADRNLLLNYIDGMIKGVPSKEEVKKFAESRKVKKVNMKSSWPFLHIDDDPLANPEGATITTEVVQGTFKFA